MAAAQCVVVLDTNVLHCVRLYLTYANRRRRYPHEGVQWSKTKTYIERRVKEERLRKSLICGGEVLHFMESNGVELSRCSAVELELFRLEAFSCGLGKAIRKSQVRGRWFSRFEDKEVNWWMTRKERQSIVASLEETFETLDSLSIRVSELDPGTASGVVDLARGIAAIVYMDALDGVVYAHALAAAATHLVTRDSRLKTVVNDFKNPSSEEKKADSEALSSLVEQCTGMKLAYRDFPVSQRLSKLSPLNSDGR